MVDPELKINKRFKEFSERLISLYTMLYGMYCSALNEIEHTYERDEAQELITVLYLQDISMRFLDSADDDPMKALDALVDYFEEKLSKNKKQYDRMAIKFYLINEMIKCNVFPNERGEYYDGEF